MLRVTEIFRSIQGESTHAGRPCTFVRLTGCPMRCVWCDSEYTFTGGEHVSVDDVMQHVERHADRFALAQALSAGLVGATTRNLNTAAIALLVTTPAANRTTPEAFAAALGQGLADRHAVLGGPREP